MARGLPFADPFKCSDTIITQILPNGNTFQQDFYIYLTGRCLKMAKFEAGMESMVDTYIFETTSLLEELDQILMKTESEHSFSPEEINEIFRTMHTIKGSSAMMGLDNMSKLAHSIEDMFYVIREENPVISDMNTLYDILFSASDLLKAEIELIQEDEYTPTDFTAIMQKIEAFAAVLKGGADAPAAAPAPAPAASAPAQTSAPAASSAADDDITTVKVTFDDDCKMENLRALLVVNKIAEDCEKLEYIPADIETNPETAKDIIENGFIIKFKPSSDMDIDSVISLIGECSNVKSYDIVERGRVVELVGRINVKVTFEEDCKMENLRALIVINNIRDKCKTLTYEPSDIEENSADAQIIIDNGFMIHFEADDPKGVIRAINGSPNVKRCEILSSDSTPAAAPAQTAPTAASAQAATSTAPAAKPAAQPEKKSVEQINNMLGNKGSGAKQSLISVNLNKLDTLLDLVGEIVITEAMVTSNPDLKGLRLDNFQKSARQLRKLNSELQDTVMSIRMVPISGAFNKMTRIVRDMKVKLGKDVDLVFEGEETEVDKSIIDQLNDPLMHMVRNSMDHGIEDHVEDRIARGKPAKGKITLSAYNSSNEVIIVVADDGAGINSQKVVEKAEKNGLLTKPVSEYTDKEIYNMIMLPGFSTNDQVTEYSGRGVGMDVVKKNIEKVGGSVSVDSKWGEGSQFIIKIPLSLSIVDGMEVSVGQSIFTIPINSIRESFKVKPNQLIKDTDGKEMIMIRGECFPLIRLYDIYDLEPKTTDLYEGIVILAEAEGKCACIFADELIGEQQVVVKPFSSLLNNFNVKQNGMAGCSILGDGSITIILDVANILGGF